MNIYGFFRTISSSEKKYLLSRIRKSKLTHGLARLKDYNPEFLNGKMLFSSAKVTKVLDLYEFTEEERSERISDILIKIFETLPSLDRIRDEDLFTPCVKYFQEQALQELMDIRNWENGNFLFSVLLFHIYFQMMQIRWSTIFFSLLL